MKTEAGTAATTAQPGRFRTSRIGIALAALAAFAALTSAAEAQNLDEMTLDRWKKLRETERYQLKIADDFYIKQQWKIAAAEYEKFQSLYEKSEGASYAQLRWANCQVRLKKVNTAISDGYQTTIDYWPDSPEAIASAFYIGRSYKDTGELKKAKKAYQEVLKKHPDHLVAVYSAADMIEIAQQENDAPTQVAMWKKLTFDTKRTPWSRSACEKASRELAAHMFAQVNVDEAVKALETTYTKPEQVPPQIVALASGPIAQMVADSKSQAKGEKLADSCIAWLKSHTPDDKSTPEKKAIAEQSWFCVADIESAAKRDAKVLETYATALKVFGEDDAILGRQANWYKTRGKWDDARKTYNRYKNQVDGQAEIAQSWYQENQFEKAANAYRQVLALDPQNPIKWKPSIAYCYRRAGKTDDSVAAYDELVVDDKASPDRWQVEAAHTYREHGKYKEAIARYRLCNPSGNCYHWMAICHRALKEYGEAIGLYNQSIGAFPDSAPSSMYQKGLTYEEQGKKELAIKTLQQVCKQFPKDSHASVAHARLQDVFKVTVTLGGDKTDQ
ncbi:MAG: tetratricopeptide repeat protein [Planctomycetaceae bacterium]|nr:tetratricopeptide repeat protein [Planctomycetaceae bacterium]